MGLYLIENNYLEYAKDNLKIEQITNMKITLLKKQKRGLRKKTEGILIYFLFFLKSKFVYI